MANAAKSKGDRAEREACEFLKAIAPNLCLEGAIRMLGAGRMDDVGDLRVFDDVAIQVRNYRVEAIGLALRSSATDSTKQAVNGRVPHGLGLVPVPRARKETVRWLASVEEWPIPLWADGGLIQPEPFKLVSKAVTWLRDEKGTHDRPAVTRNLRVAHLTGSGAPVYIAPIEAWLESYATLRGLPLVSLADVIPILPHREVREEVSPFSEII